MSEDEFRQLEENCRRDGILDSLKVWNGFLIDGHNRFKISEEWDLNYEVCEIDRPNRDAVKAWIANNQLGRRNISDLEKIRLARIARPEIERKAEKKMLSTLKQNAKTEDTKSCPRSTQSRKEKRENSTAYKLSHAAGMGEEKFKHGEAILDSGNEELIQQVQSGAKTINQGWLELKEKERKRADLSAKVSLADAEERHEDFQNSITVTMQDVAQDKKDLSEIARNRRNELHNAIKKILFFEASKADFSTISTKTVSKEEVGALLNELDVAIAALSKIRDSIGG